MEKFQGTWIYVSDVIDGRDVDVEEWANVRVIVTGETYVITKDGEVVSQATNKIDPSQRPKTFDAKFTAGPAVGLTIHGIYKFQGDTITLCAIYGEEKPRPAEFTSQPGSGHRLTVYRKVVD